ncbi:histidinol-phosphatase HisJ family protein [Tepidibacter aestuarii]|uniref:histidinol-phosphatase HisJ family protein n=1 Tax=Tepidibacter aestuarii TaxID=2925782 RepID=UPI0020C071FE|nr:histidinol-phosphatase HisJ family protein [Tepidibacter aestuarii]CAH2214581.1 Histidinol-phosphatase [Tepidibacter aestuarii]
MRFITDHHVHTEFSGDCNTPMEDVINRAIELGLKEVMFTDHVDFDFPNNKISFEIDYEEYMRSINKFRKKYKEIDILMGVEIGYQPNLNNKIDKLLSSYDFDFVIGSIHAWEGIELDTGNLFKGKSQQEGYIKYFEMLKHTIENFDNCDVYGHLDFIVRYGNFKNKVLKYEDYKAIIDEILYMIIKNGKGIEVNTSGLRYKLDNFHPSKDILTRYFEMGGEIITLGSDAHRCKDLCADFDIAIDQLKKIGFKQITQFKNRKPSFIKI